MSQLIDAVENATPADLAAIDAKIESLKEQISGWMDVRELIAARVGEPTDPGGDAGGDAGGLDNPPPIENGVHHRTDIDMEAIRRDATVALRDGPLGVRDLAKRAGYRSMEITAAMAGDERFAKVYGKWQLADRGVTA